MAKKTVELLGGPLDGKHHELMDRSSDGLGEPARLGINVGGKVADGGYVAWYERGEDGAYRYVPDAPKIMKENE